MTGFFLSLLNPPQDAFGEQNPLPWIARGEQEHSRAGLRHFLGSFCDRLVGFERPEESVVVNKLTVLLLQLEIPLGFWVLEIPSPPADWHPALLSQSKAECDPFKF